ncbi:hypothetical protein RSAG8_11081, partial [Rhizoctonia solani AG-8 WAC10335]
MQRLNECLMYLLIVTLISNDVTARPITSNSFYDADTLHIFDEPGYDVYDDWSEYTWRISERRAQPWRSGVYHSQGNAFHRRNYASSSMIEFEDSEVWLYRPPRRQLRPTPVEYEVCLENYGTASETICYQVNTVEYDLDGDDYDAPPIQRTKGGLHRTVELDGSQSTESSDATHTAERPTQWSKFPPTQCHPGPVQPPSPIRPSKSLPLHPPPRSAQRPRPGPIRRPISKRPPHSRPLQIASFTFWFYVTMVVFWSSLVLRKPFIQMRSRQRERERLLAGIRAPRPRVDYTRPRNEPGAAPSPLSSTQPLSFHTPPSSPSSDTSDSFAIPPSYADVIREQEESLH